LPIGTTYTLKGNSICPAISGFNRDTYDHLTVEGTSSYSYQNLNNVPVCHVPPIQERHC